jgi:hsp70-interacting protein
MESLLRWSLANTPANPDQSASSSEGNTVRKNLDPAIIDHILGPSDAQLMKEALAKAQDESLSDDARVQALDDLEMVRKYGFQIYITLTLGHSSLSI